MKAFVFLKVLEKVPYNTTDPKLHFPTFLTYTFSK